MGTEGDVMFFVFPQRDGRARLYLNYATEDLPPSADSDPQRMAYVEKARAFVVTLREILAANGVQLYVPVIFWKQNGNWLVYVGYDPNTFPQAVIARLAGA